MMHLPTAPCPVIATHGVVGGVGTDQSDGPAAPKKAVWNARLG
jgi:hypothetical protein